MNEAGRRVLLIEDEFLVATLIGDMLADLGYQVSAVADRLEPALALARDGVFDLALLDLTLHGRMTYPVAAILQRRAVPFAFVTGHGPEIFADGYADVPMLQKPFRIESLAATIRQLVE